MASPMLSLRLDPNLLDRVDASASELGCRRSEVVRQAIIKYYIPGVDRDRTRSGDADDLASAIRRGVGKALGGNSFESGRCRWRTCDDFLRALDACEAVGGGLDSVVLVLQEHFMGTDVRRFNEEALENGALASPPLEDLLQQNLHERGVEVLEEGWDSPARDSELVVDAILTVLEEADRRRGESVRLAKAGLIAEAARWSEKQSAGGQGAKT